MSSPVYLDYHATTPVDQQVLETMLPYFTTRFGNPASRSHSYGWQADEGVNIARQQVAALLDVDPASIYFTSGATEGMNMLLKGMAETDDKRGKHIVSVVTEHPAVLDVLGYLATKGFEIEMLPVDPNGHVPIDQFTKSIRSDTLFATVMWANNETGVIHDVHVLAAACREKGIPFICDATQAVGKIAVHPQQAGVDMIAFSAHKCYGPKGVGAVYINPSLKRKPTALLHGGGHEKGLRSGTLNVPGIVGLGAAALLAKEYMIVDQQRIDKLRDQFERELLQQIEGATVNGDIQKRLHTVSNIQLPWTDSQAIMSAFRTKLAISSGSACSAADPSPSHVLIAMGLTPAQAKGSLRISLGRPTTEEEIIKASKLISDAVNDYRTQSPAWNMYKLGLITDESGWE